MSLDSGDVVLTCTWPAAAALLLVGPDGEVVDRLGTSLSGSVLTARVPAATALPPGAQARLVLDTEQGRLPLARQHHDVDRPGEAVVLPVLVDRTGRTGALRLRHDRDGGLLLQRATPRRAAR